MTRFRFLTSFAIITVSFAQGPPVPSFTELKTYLTLTDNQVQALQQLRQNQASSLSSIHSQIQTAQQSLHDKLQAGSTDAAALGSLLLQITGLEKQVQQSQTTLTTQATATLTADQQTKLKSLQAAANLMPDIQQAQMLGLLAPPVNGPVGFGGPGVRGFGGPGRPMNRPGPPPPAN